MQALLLGAGQAVWNAGPLVKGYGLCHGTAGNGYAFLKLYQRSADPLWLERARAFAMHALAQRDRMRQAHGRGRYTLVDGRCGPRGLPVALPAGRSRLAGAGYPAMIGARPQTRIKPCRP